MCNTSSPLTEFEQAVQDLLSPYCMCSDERARIEASRLMFLAKQHIEKTKIPEGAVGI